jgi:hypothetical protein
MLFEEVVGVRELYVPLDEAVNGFETLHAGF